MRRFFGSTVLLVIVSLFVASAAVGQQAGEVQYAAKFVCGKADGKVLAPGVYLTAINVHNPTGGKITFQKKIAVALPHEKPGPVSKLFKARLGPDEALEIDCEDIFKLAETRADFLKGFVVIESKGELDVVAVYTAAGADGQVETLHTERVPARAQAGCPDLVVTNIDKPTWDGPNHRSVIKATIKNIGSAWAGPTLAKVVDPTTFQPPPSGLPYEAIAATPALDPNLSAVVTFYLPYWVYNPNVTLEVTADYKHELAECDENNNVKVFEDIG